MPANYKVLDRTDLEALIGFKQTFALDVLSGLSEPRKQISSKYFYDAEGTRLFQLITELPEYYPTRCEAEILENEKAQIARLLAGSAWNIAELGPGDGRKTNILLQQFLDADINVRYVPIDISETAMEVLTASLNSRMPQLEVQGLVSDYFNGLKWLTKLNEKNPRRNLVLFLGSNIGNFNGARARFFLRSLWSALNHDDYVLIGFDLKKDIDLMLKAYNDSKGITAEFNLNLLRRINRELGGNFDLSKFRHFASYDVFSGAMESYLVSHEQQSVLIEEIGQTFEFAPWEPIHTEYSYKFLNREVEALAAETGYVIEKRLFDSYRFFTDSIWRVQKNKPSS
jgi:L-histidine Nalpha-methyltransferase